MAIFGVEHESVKVLLLDDSALARSIGKQTLRAAGVGSVLEAANGREAIELLAVPEHGVDVLFCDLMMPDMDGLQIIRHLAGLKSPPALVFLSGGSSALLQTAEATAEARGLQVLGVVEKPLTPDAVHRVLIPLDDRPDADEGGGSFSASLENLDMALEKEQFLLHFQPKVMLAGGSVAGFESLARWQHPEEGLVSASAFIPIAERSGRIGMLTEQLMMLALKQCAAWNLAGLQTKVSVNLSAYMLVDVDLPDLITAEAKRFGIDPSQLILEVTESGLIKDAPNTLEILARLHMNGFSLSIDDFGTGYSSMKQLNRIPFAEMKIDRTFVNGASRNKKSMAILESSANLGRSLNMVVVAEGAETSDDLAAVRAAGIDLVQGYFIAKPMPAEMVPAWLNDWDRNGETILSAA